MKNSFSLDSIRQVRHTLNRFLAIVVITLLGVAFFSGLRATGPAMRATGSDYLDSLHFMDIRLLSTIGFNGEDIEAVSEVDGVEDVEPGYSLDALVQMDGENLTVRLHSLSRTVNLPDLVEGRFPAKTGECLADPEFLKQSGKQVGDEILLLSGTSDPLEDSVATDTYTITGVARSPLYIAEDRGASSVGDGSTDAYLYLPDEDFVLEVFTDVYLTLHNGNGASRFDDVYTLGQQPRKDALEEAGKIRSAIRYGEIRKEAQLELDDAQKEVDDGWRELRDAEQELADARAELADGIAEYEDGKAAFADEMRKARAELDDGWAQYESGLAEYEAVLAEYEAGLAAYEAESGPAEKQLADAEAKLEAGQAQYDEGMADLKKGKELQAALSGALAAGGTPEAIGTISAIAAQLQSTQSELAAVLQAYAANPADPAAAAAARGAATQFGNTLSASEAQLTTAKAELDKGWVEVAAGKQELEDGKAQLDSAKERLDAARVQLDSAKAELDAGETALVDGRIEGQAKLDDAAREIEDGKIELADGEAEFAEESADAEKELTDAEQEIADAQQELDDFEMPEWYVLDTETNAGFMSYKQDTQRLDAIGVVIPIFFFMIAVFVTMTSMTRLVENDRTNIGTYKALGYSRRRIATRYFLYAFFASLIGGVAGVLIGVNFLPGLIANTYAMMYTLPPLINAFPVGLAVLSVSLAVACAALPAFLVCLATVREAPAELLRPEAPKSGKRIFLEKLTPIWNRLSFSHKVSMRNIFRYKKRLVMTLIGVAGCTALMFAGFSIQDSLSTISPKQYGILQRYDMQVGFSQDSTDPDVLAGMEGLEQDENVEGAMRIRQQAMDVLSGNVLKTASLIVPEDPDRMDGFIRLQDRRTGQPIALEDDGAVISEKLAGLLDVGVGDSFKLRDGNGAEASVTVGGITENYLGHYVYLSPALYEQAFGEAYHPNQGLYLLADTSRAEEEALSRQLMEEDGVSSVSFLTDARGDMGQMMEALNVIVLVLVVSAAALVFVVLFSLLSINIEERRRELATIEVLGFTDRELSRYVYRESNILTFLGIVIGLVCGVFLERFILSTMETNFMMFSRDILWTSFAWSAGLTALFAWVVNLLMLPHIRKIDMISSLKSVE